MKSKISPDQVLAIDAVVKRIRGVSRSELREAMEFCTYFVADGAFDQPDIEASLFGPQVVLPQIQTAWYHRCIELGGDVEYQDSGSFRGRDEKLLFHRYNYARKRALELKTALLAQPGLKLAREFIHWYQRARSGQELLVEANLALVLAMARRCRAGTELSELISEGNMALIRAVDKFDVSRGFRFSTYACRAIVQAFGRVTYDTRRYRDLFSRRFDTEMEKRGNFRTTEPTPTFDALEDLRSVLKSNRANLSAMEMRILDARFPTGQSKVEEGLTLAEVGKMIGLTKERVRQIQNGALEKLREVLEAAPV